MHSSTLVLEDTWHVFRIKQSLRGVRFVWEVGGRKPEGQSVHNGTDVRRIFLHAA